MFLLGHEVFGVATVHSSQAAASAGASVASTAIEGRL